MRPFLLSLAALLFALATPRAQAAIEDFSSLENTAIQAAGRQRPFGTFARETLQRICGRATYRDGGEKRSAPQVIFELAVHPDQWQERPLILISYRPLLKAVGLPEDRKLFSLSEIFGHPALLEKAMEAEKLRRQPGKPELSRELKEASDVMARVGLVQSITNGDLFTFVPGPEAQDPKSEAKWLTPAQAAAAYPGEAGKAAAASGAELFQAYAAGDQAAFASAAAKLTQSAAALNPKAMLSTGRLELETHYGNLHPFRWAWVLYAVAAIVLGLTSLAGRSTGYRIAWALVIAGFALQVYGFIARVLISGRGPVTNMYESVVWVAFGAVLFAIVMEAIYRSRYLFLAATPVAVVSLILADTQTDILNPAIDPLTGVLRSNFWLSTHVTSITLSYAAFALALGVGHIILGKIILRRPVSAALYNYLYRALQIGVLLLAIGTILGGVWANYSWGRFWDWDPKETWALIALLGYLALLHGRIAGWWKGFGLAVGSIVAFQSVVMAWYGVNFVLGQGLHSYGFGTGGFPAVLGYVILELVFLGLVFARRGGKPMAGSQKQESQTLKSEKN